MFPQSQMPVSAIVPPLPQPVVFMRPNQVFTRLEQSRPVGFQVHNQY